MEVPIFVLQVTLAIVLLLGYLTSQCDLGAGGNERDRKPQSGYCLLAACVLCFLVGMGISLLLNVNVASHVFIDGLIARAASEPLLAGILMIKALAVGITEEVIFRGYLLAWLNERTNFMIALIVTSVLFSAGHLASLSGNMFVARALIGALLAATVKQFGSLTPAIVLHTAIDIPVLLSIGRPSLLSHF